MQSTVYKHSHFIKCKFAHKSNVETVSEYAEDIYDYLRTVEQSRYKITFSSIQSASSRPELLSLLMKAAEAWKLPNNILHLAVYYLDNFMNVYAVAQDNLRLLAMTSLILAKKFEGSRAERSPTFKTLNPFFNMNYDVEKFKRFESYMIQVLRLDFNTPTIATFADYYAQHAVNEEDFQAYKKKIKLNKSPEINTMRLQPYIYQVLPKYDCCCKLNESVNNLIKELSNMCLAHIKLMNTLPSLLAAACVAAARSLHNFDVLWSRELQIISKYEIKEIFELMELILSFYESNTICILKHIGVKVERTPNMSINNNMANKIGMQNIVKLEVSQISNVQTGATHQQVEAVNNQVPRYDYTFYECRSREHAVQQTTARKRSCSSSGTFETTRKHLRVQ